MSIGFSPLPELRRMSIGLLPLESVESIDHWSISWVEHGLADRDAPVALVPCAMGSTHQCKDSLIGPCLPLDTRRLHMLAVIALGNGLSTSPFNSTQQPVHTFPVFSIRPMVASVARLLDELAISRLALVPGASMDGLQALEWGVRGPLRMDRIVALSPLARTPGWSRGINEAARRALQPLVAPGVWTGRNHPASALEGRALIMHLQAARTPEQVTSEILDHHALSHWLARPAQEWTERRFDPLDWVYQSLEYGAHDVVKTSSTQGDTALALALGNIQAKTLVLGTQPDLYNPVDFAEWASKQISGCVYAAINSDWGQLTFSAADTGNAALLRQYVSQILWASESRS